MTSIVIKIIDKNKPDLVEIAKAELIGAGFAVILNTETDMLGVDAVKHGGTEQIYGSTVVIIGEK